MTGDPCLAVRVRRARRLAGSVPTPAALRSGRFAPAAARQRQLGGRRCVRIVVRSPDQLHGGLAVVPRLPTDSRHRLVTGPGRGLPGAPLSASDHPWNSGHSGGVASNQFHQRKSAMSDIWCPNCGMEDCICAPPKKKEKK